MNPRPKHRVLSVLAVLIIGLTRMPISAEPGSKELFDISVQTIDGTDRSLMDYQGKTLLIINVASKCGLTPQYKELQTLYEKYRERGFTILAFPANNFRDQEPGSNDEIKAFCESTFGVTFPLFAKVSVAGDDIHPLFALLTDSKRYPESGGPIRWNFDKFLISFDGRAIKRFEPRTKPLAEKLTGALEAMLKPETIKPPCCR